MVAIVEHYGGDIFFDLSLIKHEKRSDKEKGVNEKTDQEYRQLVRDKKMAMAFLLSANKKIYGSLLDKLSDSYSFNIDVYPRTLNLAYELLVKHAGKYKPNQRPKQKKNDTKKPATNQNNASNQSEEGNALTFAQSHELVAGTNEKIETCLELRVITRKTNLK